MWPAELHTAASRGKSPLHCICSLCSGKTLLILKQDSTYYLKHHPASWLLHHFLEIGMWNGWGMRCFGLLTINISCPLKQPSGHTYLCYQERVPGSNQLVEARRAWGLAWVVGSYPERNNQGWSTAYHRTQKAQKYLDWYSLYAIWNIIFNTG